MMVNFLKVSIICLLFIVLTAPEQGKAQSIDDFTIMTEQYPPHNFQVDGELRGISADIMTLMLSKLGSKLSRKDIEVLPWARGYHETLNHSNKCLFSTTRTEERENLFKWVGPISPTKVALIAKKSRNIQINSIDDLSKYTIGVITDDIAEQTLINMRVDGLILDDVSRTIMNIKKLNSERIDLWGYAEEVAKWELKSNGFNPNEYETVYVLQANELYFAFNMETPDKLINQLQRVLDEIKETGEQQKIIDKYTK